MIKKNLFYLMLLMPLIIACKTTQTTNVTIPKTLVAYSSAFVDNGTYPKLYTCDSLSLSPPIAWKTPPTGTVGYAITMHTIPTTGDKHVYMVLYNIPSTVMSIPQAVPGVGIWGLNSFGRTIYDPPCSQGPGLKTYIITVYALSKQPVFTVASSAVTMDILLSAISTTTLNTSTLTVNYSR